MIHKAYCVLEPTATLFRKLHGFNECGTIGNQV